MNIILNSFAVLLQYIFGITGDWGISIVVLTLFIKFMLSPLSFNQKLSLLKQQKMGEKIEKLKSKYKHNKEKMKEEIEKCYKDGVKNMFGCLITFIQLPVIWVLYSTVINMPVAASSMLVPWIASIKMSDSYYIVPLIYSAVSTFPFLINYVDYFNIYKQVQSNRAGILISVFVGVMITFKAPIAIGIYFITSNMFSFIEDVVFRVYVRNKSLV
ncbi:membrane protein insertase YidC [Clostridium sp. LBM24168]